ncbi:RNA polymerase sigma factor [Thermospira aquatica]|uniref:Sigma-70 family RNA polymerase sigma factor n=1 Tax=Thermospira aquatica TaxID=2828656 RepID=A0AAX3BD81_9SPIR|nr:sigma-70 family RNA polymerase sigma factor [Thermospira aquatica]URA10140.1 sigma-70 family RNA polymerase sigma factor [Thermospira aquatica]
MEFERFYLENQDLFYRWAYSHTRERENARDIVQEAAMIVAKRWSRIQHMDNALGYMLRVITNLAKKQARRPAAVFLDDTGWENLSEENKMDSTLEQQEQEEWIYRMLDHLKPEERAVLLLRDIEEMDFAGLAQKLGMNLSTAKSHYRRAKLKLLKLWEETYGKDNLQ